MSGRRSHDGARGRARLDSLAERTPRRTEHDLWCVDSFGAYLELRSRGVADIAGAVRALARSPRVSPAAFDIIADGLHLYLLELEDEHLAPVLTTPVVEQLLTLAAVDG